MGEITIWILLTMGTNAYTPMDVNVIARFSTQEKCEAAAYQILPKSNDDSWKKVKCIRAEVLK